MTFLNNTSCAVTAANLDNIVIYQNSQSLQVNGDKRGQSLIPCHNERSRAIIAELLDGRRAMNAYTISKKGLRKMIYQTPWRDENGEIKGLLEISMPLPAGPLPHYDRG